MSTKTKEEVLSSEYMSAKELKVLMPQKSLDTCRMIIFNVREIMESKQMFCPPGKPFIALTSEIKKYLGIRG